MAQHCQKMTFSPSSSSALTHQLHHSHSHLTHPHHNHQHHHLSFNGHMMPAGTESGYDSAFSISRPLDFSLDGTTVSSRDASPGEAQTTPRTTAAINYMSALQLSTPRIGVRSGRKGTPLKRQQPAQSLFHGHHSTVYETTPKKPKGHENIENETSYISRSAAMKVPFRARLDRSLSQTMSPLPGTTGVDKLDCTFDAISSSTPICQPFRAEFYEQHVEAIPLKNLTRSGGKNTRTKIIRKMQSFSPRKLMGLRAAKVPLREMDQNSVDFQRYSAGLFPVEEEESSPIPKTHGGAVKKVLFSDAGGSGGAFSSGLRDLMFGTIKTNAVDEQEEVEHKQSGGLDDLDTTNTFESSVVKDEETIAGKQQQQLHHQETSSQLLDIYVTNLSNLDGGDSNSHPMATAEDGDVSMNTSMTADVERYFDELKRNTTQVQEHSSDKFVPLATKNSLDLYDMLQSDDNATTQVQEEASTEEMVRPMEVEVVVSRRTEEPIEERKPMLLRKRKRPSTEQIQAVLATPKKMRRSQSFHMGDGQVPGLTTDENMESFHHLTDVSNDASYPSHLVSPTQRLGGARKRLNYEPVARNRFSPAKRTLAFDAASRRRTLTGTARLNIFRHLANCPPVRDYFFDFVDDKDLVAIYAVSRQCRAMIEEHPRLNGRRMQYLEAAWRKKENNDYSTCSSSSSSASSPDEPLLRIQGETIRIPLHNRNVDTSCASSISDTMSPPVSPSRRKFHENQKVCCGVLVRILSFIDTHYPLSLSLLSTVGATESGGLLRFVPSLSCVQCHRTGGRELVVAEQ